MSATRPEATRERSPRSLYRAADILPYDEEAERSVIGAMLEGVPPELAEAVARLLDPNDFHSSEHRLIWAAVGAVHGGGDHVDVTLVKAELDDRGELARITGGPLALHDLASSCPFPGNALRYAERVAKLARDRRAAEASHEIMQAAAEGQDWSALVPKLAQIQTEIAGATFEPLDWDALQAEGLPESTYLREPYVPAEGQVWLWGPTESVKSLWAQFLSAELSRKGITVLYFSQENVLAEDVRRLRRLRPNWDHLRYFHDQGVDLADLAHVAEVVRIAKGVAAKLLVFDTLSGCWSGEEDSNREITALDREVLLPMVREIDATVMILDHTGHPKEHLSRTGADAGRGASAKGQKGDVVLEFRRAGDGRFKIVHGKNRMGGQKERPRTFTVIDAEDGGLVIAEAAAGGHDPDEAAAAQALALVAAQPDHYSKTSLAMALGGRKEDALDLVDHLIAEGRIGPDKAKAKLRVTEEGS